MACYRSAIHFLSILLNLRVNVAWMKGNILLGSPNTSLVNRRPTYEESVYMISYMLLKLWVCAFVVYAAAHNNTWSTNVLQGLQINLI